MPVIPALKLRQEDGEFVDNLAYIESPLLLNVLSSDSLSVGMVYV